MTIIKCDYCGDREGYFHEDGITSYTAFHFSANDKYHTNICETCWEDTAKFIYNKKKIMDVVEAAKDILSYSGLMDRTKIREALKKLEE